MKKGKTFFPVLREEVSEEIIDVQVADMAWQLHSVDVLVSLQCWTSQDSDEQHSTSQDSRMNSIAGTQGHLRTFMNSVFMDIMDIINCFFFVHVFFLTWSI